MSDAGEDRDLGRNRATRIHQGLERTQTFTPSEFDCPDLGDRTGISRPTCGFEIDDAEGHLRKRSTEIVERKLNGVGGGGSHFLSLIERVFVCKDR